MFRFYHCSIWTSHSGLRLVCCAWLSVWFQVRCSRSCRHTWHWCTSWTARRGCACSDRCGRCALLTRWRSDTVAGEPCSPPEGERRCKLRGWPDHSGGNSGAALVLTKVTNTCLTFPSEQQQSGQVRSNLSFEKIIVEIERICLWWILELLVNMKSKNQKDGNWDKFHDELCLFFIIHLLGEL